jgi:chloramphenicol 3-O phosphotransferase
MCSAPDGPGRLPCVFPLDLADSLDWCIRDRPPKMKAHPMMPGKIIILNGTSSSGKTSIVRALQDILEEPFLDAGIDKFIWMLPQRYLDRPLWDEVLGLATEAGAVGRRLMSGMHHSIAALSRAGNNVVAEHVLVERQWLEECTTLFSELPALFVGARCSLEVLERREAARKDRTLGQARAQFPLVHAHGVYDLEVDTSEASATECALQIKRRLEDARPPDAFNRLRQQGAG